MPDSQEGRMARLSARSEAPRAISGYTHFVRFMRLALPLAAIGVVTVLFIVTGGDNARIVPVQEPSSAEDNVKDKKIAKNELLNPEFESRDKKNQPYKITASRAVQGEINKDLIMLERPVGVMTMQDGEKVTVHSLTGAYRQDTERFFLEGGVLMEHAQGYSLESEEAHIDLKKSFAWSEQPVKGNGPDLHIDASGMRANGETGEIVFVGPAKLVLKDGLQGGGL